MFRWAIPITLLVLTALVIPTVGWIHSVDSTAVRAYLQATENREDIKEIDTVIHRIDKRQAVQHTIIESIAKELNVAVPPRTNSNK